MRRCIWAAVALGLAVQAQAGEIVENKTYTGPKTTISYSMWGGADEVTETRTVCNAFVKLHPDIRVDVSIYPWGQYWTKMQTEVASGIAPDVLEFYSGAFGVWAGRGALLPLDSYIQAAGMNMKNYRPPAVANCTWQGHIEAMPTEIAIWSLIYSVNRLEESGVKRADWPKSNAPMPWDTFQQLAQRLTLRRPDGSVAQYGMSAGQNYEYALTSMDGGYVTNRQVDPTHPTVLNNDKLRSGLLKLFDSEYATNTTIGSTPLSTDSSINNTDDLLISPRYAMGTTGPWALPELQKEGVQFGLSPLPEGPHPSNLISVNSVAISSQCKHPKEAFELLEYLGSLPVQNLYGRDLKGVPSLIAAAPSFLHNKYNIPGCEAFLYDVDIAAPYLTTNVNDVFSAVQTWYNDLGQTLSDDYDSHLAAVPRHHGAISEADYNKFVATMKGVVAKDVDAALPQLNSQLATGFAFSTNEPPNLLVTWIGPAALLLAFIVGIAGYLAFVKRANAESLPQTGRQQPKAGFGFLSPWLVGLFCFTLGPLIAALLLSFTRWNMVTPPHWVGLQNYVRLPHDSKFWIGIQRTVLYALLVIPISLIGGLTTAGVLTTRIRGGNLFKAIIYLPSLFTGAEAAVLWVHMLNKDHGVVNELLGWLHIAPVNWLDATHAFYSVVMMNFFWIGGSMLIYYAGMKQIPASLYEAAELDGASVATRFLKITIPMLSPVILFLTVVSTIGAFQVFTPALFFASSSNAIGQPGDSLRFYAVNIYDQAFNNLEMGLACSYAVVLFVIIFGVTAVQLRLAKRYVYSEAGS